MELTKNAKLMISYLFDRISSLEVDTIELSFNDVENIGEPIKINNKSVFDKKDYNIEEIILDPSRVQDIDSKIIENINIFVDEKKASFLQLTGIVKGNDDFILSLGLLSSNGKIACPQIESDRTTGPRMISVDFDLIAK